MFSEWENFCFCYASFADSMFRMNELCNMREEKHDEEGLKNIKKRKTLKEMIKKSG